MWVYDNIVEVLKSFTTPDRLFDIYYKHLEYQIVQVAQNFKNIIGFIDLRVEGRSFSQDEAGNVTNETRFTVSVEVKTEILSCRELLRQINFYRRFEMGSSIWIVVSMDDRFADTLRGQGIYFLQNELIVVGG